MGHIQLFQLSNTQDPPGHVIILVQMDRENCALRTTEELLYSPQWEHSLFPRV